MIRGCLYSGVCPFPNEGIREIFFLRLSAIMLFPVHRHLHLLPITLATKAWQHWSTFSVSIKNKVFVFNSIVYQGGTCQLHDLVVMKRLLREWEQFWTASSLRCLIERRRLGTEPKFCQQAWQVTSHLTSPRTTENKADFSTLYNSLQDFTGKEVGVKVSLTSNK